MSVFDSIWDRNDPRYNAPDLTTLGIEAVHRAYSIAEWERQWEAATGRSWAARYRPTPKARIDLTLADPAYLSSAVVTDTGMLPLSSAEVVASVDDGGTWVRLTVPMAHVTVTSR